MTTPAKRTPAKTPAVPAKTAPLKAVPASDAKPKFDLEALAAQSKQVEALPKIGSGASGDNPFRAKVRQSYTDGKPNQLPPIPADAVTPVIVSIRRGATLEGLGVSIRKQETEQGIVISYQGKVRSVRDK